MYKCVNKVYYRPNCSTLADALVRQKGFPSIKEMAEYLAKELNIAKGDVYISYYCYDERIKQDTYIVTIERVGKENYCKKYGCPQAVGYCTMKKAKVV